MARQLTLAAVLLTIGTGGTDVLSLTRLGSVFASVMTGNLVLLGLSAARASAALAGHTAVAIGGYVLGVAMGARLIALAPGRRRGTRPRAAGPEGWPVTVTAALMLELVLLAAFAAGWELAGSHSAGACQYLLLVTATVAMGMQSTAVRGFGRGEYATTYLTGTLTSLIAGLVTPGTRRWPGWRQPGALLALAAGALINGILVAHAPAAVPAVIIAPLCIVLALRAATRRRNGKAAPTT
ncbi:MAG: DUF1275 domain-containing protein [Kitasatospora sp.]|nr:DUF1275 domain-containing protein [Kitasatospora sp.]